MPRPIQLTSPKNPVVLRVKDAAQGELPGEMVVEGNRLVEDVLSAELPIRIACYSDKLTKAKNGFDLRRRLEQRSEEVYACDDAVMARMSALTTHQGVLCVVERPEWSDADLLGPEAGKALVVAAAGVRDPGNLGAMLRATEAAHGTGFLALKGGADPFRDKAARGSAGSVLRLPTRYGVSPTDVADYAKAQGLALVAADGRGETDYLDHDWTRPTLVALGNEGAGLPDELLSRCDAVLRIPIAPSVESLNVAVAAGVLLYEARRQRR